MVGNSLPAGTNLETIPFRVFGIGMEISANQYNTPAGVTSAVCPYLSDILPSYTYDWHTEYDKVTIDITPYDCTLQGWLTVNVGGNVMSNYVGAGEHTYNIPSVESANVEAYWQPDGFSNFVTSVGVQLPADWGSGGVSFIPVGRHMSIWAVECDLKRDKREFPEITYCNQVTLGDPHYSASNAANEVWIKSQCPNRQRLVVDPQRFQYKDHFPGADIPINLTLYSADGKLTTVPAGIIKLTATHSNACPGTFDVSGCESNLILDSYVDVDVDSCNTNGFNVPNWLDQSGVDETNFPGKILYANRGDADNDGIPDFVDGFHWQGNTGDYSECVGGAPFVPMSVKLPSNITLSDARLNFSYAYSDPASIHLQSNGDWYAPGGLRLWKVAADKRHGVSDLVTNGCYDAADLSWDTDHRTILYIEGISDGQYTITVSMGPTGGAVLPWSDSVAVTVAQIDCSIDSICTNAIHDSHIVTTKVSQVECTANTMVNYSLSRLSGEHGSVVFADDTSTCKNVLGGQATLTLSGLEPSDAVSNMVMKATVGGYEYMSKRFTVFDMTSLSAWEKSPHNRQESGAVSAAVSDDTTNVLYVCQSDDGYGQGTEMAFSRQFMPCMSEKFLWEIVTTNGERADQDWSSTFDNSDEDSIILNPGVPANRDFILRAWYDCNGDGLYTNTEPHRLIDVKVVDVVDLVLSNEANGVTVTSTSRSEASSAGNTLNLAEDTNKTATMTIQPDWEPEDVPAAWIHWEILNLDGTPATNGWSSQASACDGDSSSVTWTDSGDSAAARQFIVRTWYDCDRDGAYSDSEPVRIAYVNIIKVNLVPDFNHDRVIDDADVAMIETNGPFRFWINDNQELSDADGNDWPGCNPPDWQMDHPNGVRDLVDFFPVYLDIGQALQCYPTNQYRYVLKQADSALKGVPTRLYANSENEDWKPEAYQIQPNVAGDMTNAVLQVITNCGVEITGSAMDRAVELSTGIVMVLEGTCVTTNPLVLEIRQRTGDTLIARSEMPLSLSSVTNMFRTVNLLGMESPGTLPGPSNYPDSLASGTNLVFVHGYQPGTDDVNWPVAWLSTMFKRFYWSGSKAKYHGVLWRSHGNSKSSYQPAVTNAFAVASALSAYVNNLDGPVTIVAHSLGNMAVSSAICDYNMNVANYMMCDAAVPSEAYDSATQPTTQLINVAWAGYSNQTWAANWYLLFQTNGDSRANLKWPGRFAAVAANASLAVWNFYSTGDEVFELTSDLGTFTGVWGGIGWWYLVPHPILTYSRYTWQKQELFKGVEYNKLWRFGCTSDAGWGFQNTMMQTEDSDGKHEYSVSPIYTNAAGANTVSSDNLRTNPVFVHSPEWLVSTNALSQNQINYMLGMGIPAQTPSTGNTKIKPSLIPEAKQIDLNTAVGSKPNGWPTDAGHGGDFTNRWLHNDIKNVAYFFNYQLFDTMVSEGALK